MSEHIEGAILYLDSGCTESFQFAGGFPILLDLGVRAVCSLENLCSLDVVINWNANSDPATKIVVITSRLLSDAHRYILRCLSTHQCVQRFTVYTSISEIVHSAYPDSPLGPDAFREYESLLLQDYEELIKKRGTKSGLSKDYDFQENTNFEDEGWSHLTSSEEEVPHLGAASSAKIFSGDDEYMEDAGQKLVVSVHHFPMIFCPLSPRVFVLPSEGSVAEACLSIEHEDSISLGLPPISSGVPPDGDDVPPGALLTAHFLYHLAAKMDLKTEIYSLGDLSKTVGKIMTDMSSLYDVGRRKRSAGLLLIDRTLDLLTPCCHGDSLVDRMFSSLPRRERTTSYSHMKGSQTQVKLGPSILERASLNVQIPLAKILRGDSETNNSSLLERIEAFLAGWDDSSSAPQSINLVNLCNKAQDEKSTPSEVQLLNGSLVSTETFRGTPYMEAIFDRRTKDGALLVRKWLQETLRRENIAINVKTRPGFATKSELKPMIETLAKSQSSSLRNKGIIQLAAAVLVALDESHCARWDALTSAEKILSASAGDTSQSLAAQISDLIHKSTLSASSGQKSKTEPLQTLLSFQDALFLMIVGYILAGENFPTSGLGGPFSWEEEHFLKEAVLDAILENASASKLKFLHGLTEELEANFNRKKLEETKETSPDTLEIDDFDDDQWGKWGDEEEDDDDKNRKEKQYGDMQLRLELRDRVDSLFKYLHKLSSLKRRNAPLREGTFYLESNLGGDPDSNKGLLYKILRSVLSKNDVPGLEYHSSTVGRLFKSGFGRFGLGQAKPSLADQNVILVFIVGGINGTEVREAWEAISESGRPDLELIVGGTTLLTPDNMFDLLMGKYSCL
ncbi:sec1 family domain-containing protein MIP3 isoform X2 [Hevea brasiliensis]|nr:sec1 family domain-containing protein MIP3 isoform X2 [Hevea brasiliensis]